jgi:hypothetical protein
MKSAKVGASTAPPSDARAYVSHEEAGSDESAPLGAWLWLSLPAARMRRRERGDVMDGSTFDTLTRIAASSAGRRGLLRSGIAAVLAGIGAASLFGAEDAAAKSCQKKCYKKKDCQDKNDKDAKKKCKAKCKRKCRCNPKLPQADCSKSDDCCPDKTDYTCGTSHGSGSNTCCGTQGAVCGSTLDCCIDQLCVSSTCVPNPL